MLSRSALLRLKPLVMPAALCVALVGAQARLLAAVPVRHGRVNDFAGILDSNAQTLLQTRLRGAARQTGADIVLVTVKSLDGQTIDAYAHELFEAWRIGGANGNGVLVVVSPSAQRIRILAGRTLQPILPDTLADQVVRTVFVPSFERGDYRNGLLRGMQRVVAIVRRHHVLTAAERRQLAKTAGGGAPPAWMLPLLTLLVAAGAFALGVGLRTKTIVPVLWGALFGGVPLVIGVLLFLPSALAILVPPGLVTLAWGYVVGGKPRLRSLLRASADMATPGGWVVGGTGRSGPTRPPASDPQTSARGSRTKRRH